MQKILSSAFGAQRSYNVDEQKQVLDLVAPLLGNKQRLYEALDDLSLDRTTVGQPIIIGQPKINGISVLVSCLTFFGTFSCFKWTTTGLLLLKASSFAHTQEPGLFIGNVLYVMDDTNPESIDFGKATLSFTPIAAPPKKVGNLGCMAPGTNGFFHFGGSILSTEILFYNPSTNQWSNPLNKLIYGSQDTHCVTFDFTPGARKMLVGYYVPGTDLAYNSGVFEENYQGFQLITASVAADPTFSLQGVLFGANNSTTNVVAIKIGNFSTAAMRQVDLTAPRLSWTALTAAQSQQWSTFFSQSIAATSG